MGARRLARSDPFLMAGAIAYNMVFALVPLISAVVTSMLLIGATWVGAVTVPTIGGGATAAPGSPGVILVWRLVVVAPPYGTKSIIDRSIVGGRRDLLLPLVAIGIGIGVVQAVGMGFGRSFGFRRSSRAEADLRNRMFRHIQRPAFSFHDVTTTGQLMVRSSSDLSQIG